MKIKRDSEKKGTPLHATPDKMPLLSKTAQDGVNKNISFPIVGIGSSAGGLEALDLFFKNVPKGCGMAFVIIQHLDPAHKGMMIELIQRSTTMPVMQAEDNLKLRPDCVYIIPSNKDLSLLNGHLFLFTPSDVHGLRLPIDFFFRSLADDQGPQSVGVILSGMGSDGLLGIREIKARGGVVLAQEPSSAKHEGMPRSIIEAGLADIIAPAEGLPERMISYLGFRPLAAKDPVYLEEKSLNCLEKAVIMLRTKTGNDFSQYKKNTVHRRIERRMGLHKIDTIATYLRFLHENPQELELLSKELLIGVTNFFRDTAAWDFLRDEIIPSLWSAYPDGGIIRAWSAGCSTGEEAYSLAIIFREALEKLRPSQNYSIQIFATDLNPDAIEKARAGHYPANIVTDVSPKRLSRFFVQDDRGYRICKAIRETVIFAPHNITKDPPFTKLDILVCRNLLIYFEHELQKKLIPLFLYCINPGGIIFIGSAETVGAFSELFCPLNSRHRIYKSQKNTERNIRFDFPFNAYTPSTVLKMELMESPVPNFQLLMDEFLLKYYAPSAVLTNKEGHILHINGRTGKYLEPAVGAASLNIFNMAKEGICLELQNAFFKSIKENSDVYLKSIQVECDNYKHYVDIKIHHFESNHPLNSLIIIVFIDLDNKVKCLKNRKKMQNVVDDISIAELKIKLKHSREELEITKERMQVSQEELRSTNEELQSANEELQSINEELITSKEEMQSLNEELQTLNAEFQMKIDELTRANNDMENLLNSAAIATLFLDENLHVRRFTSHVTSVINLIPGDIGRPITNITTILDYPEMVTDAKEVLRTLVYCEKPVVTLNGHCFLVRIVPYRTFDNRIEGVVITFTDINMGNEFEAMVKKKLCDVKQTKTFELSNK
jgi:two-component system, chemotaxis family, CheB/CheR fusion protein